MNSFFDPRNTETMLFDLDGTLLDTSADFIAVLQEMTRLARCTPPSASQIHQTVSAGARALVTLALRLQAGDEGFDQAHQQLLALYGEQITSTQACLYPEMDALLENLEAKGIPWGIVTNKPERFTLVLLEKLGLLRRCSVLVCPEHVTHSKPHPEPLLLASRKLGLSCQNAVYAGDHPRDIESGRQAGMITVAAAYGYLPLDPPVSDWGADLIVHSVPELSQWLQLSAAQTLT